MGYLKHDGSKRKQVARPKKTESPQQAAVVVTGPESRSMQHSVNYVDGISGIEGSLESIAIALNRMTHEDYPVNLTLAQGHNTNPVQITLAPHDYDSTDVMGRVVTAFERIADSLARLAGLSRPRLESWHEQDEYEPRFKSVACDGGAPGPKVAGGG